MKQLMAEVLGKKYWPKKTKHLQLTVNFLSLS